ncbi:Calponin homology (CH) domain containing protein [Euroglyphus maynei]|uniref:Calponin homology (CH) domain containing protein n=1 Tax=Euroglyphus maynei TaxID=6958 RepID=A0A1Y3BDB4_EURMA|nr:Calponin homology (CH) domain containing protein [Euroglyphus maynei]
MAKNHHDNDGEMLPCLPMPKPRSDVDYVRESQFLLWLWKMIEEISFSYEYEQYLRDGVILCRLMQNIAPDLFHDAKQTSAKKSLMLEKGEDKQEKVKNIRRFLDACRQYGLDDSELFDVEDLLSMMDMPKVTRCLYTLGRYIAEKNGNRPTLGKPYDEWLNEQMNYGLNIEHIGSNVRRRQGMPLGDDLLVSHVNTEWLKQRLNANVGKDRRRIRRPPRDPLVQRTPSVPFANLKAIFTGESQPLQYDQSDL